MAEIMDEPDINDFVSIDSEENEENKEKQTPILRALKDSKLYVISVDDEPEYYAKTEEKAKKCMEILSKSLVNVDPNYTTVTVNVSDNEIHLEQRHNFFLVSYDEIVHTIRYDVVRGIDVTCRKKEE